MYSKSISNTPSKLLITFLLLGTEKIAYTQDQSLKSSWNRFLLNQSNERRYPWTPPQVYCKLPGMGTKSWSSPFGLPIWVGVAPHMGQFVKALVTSVHTLRTLPSIMVGAQRWDTLMSVPGTEYGAKASISASHRIFSARIVSIGNILSIIRLCLILGLYFWYA